MCGTRYPPTGRTGRLDARGSPDLHPGAESGIQFDPQWWSVFLQLLEGERD
jgi:hypothetical protein